MKQTYVIIDDNRNHVLETQSIVSRFRHMQFVGAAFAYQEGIDLVLEQRPDVVFLEINPDDKSSALSLLLISELYRYLSIIPKIIVTTKNTELAYEAIKYEVFDYFSKPLSAAGFRRSLLRLEKSKGLASIPQISANETEYSKPADQPEIMPELQVEPSEATLVAALPLIFEPEATVFPEETIAEPDSVAEVPPNDSPKEVAAVPDQDEKPLIICVKSYGDYRFIEAKDICYLQADNNSTDIHLYNGEMVTAFKTLKHFETVLSSPFVRIHNSYIVNIEYVSRIHTGNAVCYIKGTTIKLPFSKSYKENVDSILNSITNGNYLEI